MKSGKSGNCSGNQVGITYCNCLDGSCNLQYPAKSQGCPEFKNCLKDLIADDKIKEVFEVLRHLEASENEAIFALGRYKSHEEKWRKRIISFEAYELISNQLRDQCLKMVDEIPLPKIEAPSNRGVEVQITYPYVSCVTMGRLL